MENLNLILYNLAKMTVKKFFKSNFWGIQQIIFPHLESLGTGWGTKSQMVDLRPQGMDDMGGSKGF